MNDPPFQYAMAPGGSTRVSLPTTCWTPERLSVAVPRIRLPGPPEMVATLEPLNGCSGVGSAMALLGGVLSRMKLPAAAATAFPARSAPLTVIVAGPSNVVEVGG